MPINKQLNGINEFVLVGDIKYQIINRSTQAGSMFVTFILNQTLKQGKNDKEITYRLPIISFRDKVVDALVHLDRQVKVRVFGTIAKNTWKDKSGIVRSDIQLKADEVEVLEQYEDEFLQKGEKESDTPEARAKDYEAQQGKSFDINAIAKDPNHPKYKEAKEIIAKTPMTKNIVDDKPKQKSATADDEDLPF